MGPGGAQPWPALGTGPTSVLWPLQAAPGATLSVVLPQSVSDLFLKELFEMEDTEVQKKAVQMVTFCPIQSIAWHMREFQVDSVPLTTWVPLLTL